MTTDRAGGLRSIHWTRAQSVSGRSMLSHGALATDLLKRTAATAIPAILRLYRPQHRQNRRVARVARVAPELRAHLVAVPKWAGLHSAGLPAIERCIGLRIVRRQPL